MASTRVFFQLSIICFLFFFSRHALCFQLPDISALKSSNIDRIYSFGSSTSDVGNRVVEDPESKSLQPPNGMNFNQGPTGRFCDGMLIIDYTALAAGLPLIDPYLQGNSYFTQGANFAVAGATALSKEALAEKNIISFGTNSSLGVQIEWLSTHLASQCSSDIRDCAPESLENAMFMLGPIGNNDYDLALSMGQTIEDAKKLVPDIIEVIKDAVRRITSLGATQIVIPGSFPLGCFPVTQGKFKTDNQSAYDERHCLKNINDVYAFHNKYLQIAIITLQEENPTTSILYADYYNAYMWLLDNALHLGFDATSVYECCCGGGMSAAGYDYLTDFCGNSTPACSDPDRYISWDGIHMTQKANYLTFKLVEPDMIRKLNCTLQVEDH